MVTNKFVTIFIFAMEQVMTKNYVSVYHDRRSDKLKVWEKDSETHRTVMREVDPNYYFYIQDPEGEYKGIDGKQLKKLQFKDKWEFKEACNIYSKKYESDIPPADKFLLDNYFGIKAPKLNIGLLDIEVNYDPTIGYSTIADPYAEVNALTLYVSMADGRNGYITLVIPPPGWDGEIPNDINSNVVLCKNESELLTIFLDAIQDLDVLSGWNSEFFDIPYLVKRVEMVLGKRQAAKFSFVGAPAPEFKEVEKFGELEIICNIFGRIHLDYLKLFKNFTYSSYPSYSLANIAATELDIPKLEYEGSLASLYVDDFLMFIRYNIRDVEIIVELNKKFKFIELANTMVHENVTHFSSIFGSVQLIDTGVIAIMHNKMNLIVHDKVHKPGTNVEGAIVMTPVVGFHKYIGSVDLNSLYPSTYRMLNLSIEKIVGQFVEEEAAWRAIYEKSDCFLTFEYETGEVEERRATEWRELFIKNKWAISAFGTVLDQGNGQGVIPFVLELWYAERKHKQKLKKQYAKEAIEFRESHATQVSDDMLALIS